MSGFRHADDGWDSSSAGVLIGVAFRMLMLGGLGYLISAMFSHHTNPAWDWGVGIGVSVGLAACLLAALLIRPGYASAIDETHVT